MVNLTQRKRGSDRSANPVQDEGDFAGFSSDVQQGIFSHPFPGAGIDLESQIVDCGQSFPVNAAAVCPAGVGIHGLPHAEAEIFAADGQLLLKVHDQFKPIIFRDCSLEELVGEPPSPLAVQLFRANGENSLSLALAASGRSIHIFKLGQFLENRKGHRSETVSAKFESAITASGATALATGATGREIFFGTPRAFCDERQRHVSTVSLVGVERYQRELLPDTHTLLSSPGAVTSIALTEGVRPKRIAIGYESGLVEVRGVDQRNDISSKVNATFHLGRKLGIQPSALLFAGRRKHDDSNPLILIVGDSVGKVHKLAIDTGSFARKAELVAASTEPREPIRALFHEGDGRIRVYH